MFEHKAFYSPAEIAAILGVSVSYVNGQIEKGLINAIRVSPRVTRVPYAALMLLVGTPLVPVADGRTEAERVSERAARRAEDVPVPAHRLVAG